MRWFRSKRGSIAWLACFALACQLYAAFGHVHLGNKAGSSTGDVIGWAFSDASGAGSISVPPSDTKNPSSPQPNKPSGAADFCALCAFIKLASTAVTARPPTMVAPLAFHHELQWSLVATERTSFDHLPFNARGPPHA
jgi:hypothetical protein